MAGSAQVDVEKQTQTESTPVHNGSDKDRGDAGMQRIGKIQRSNVLLRGLARFEKRMDKMTGFEAMGVERVLEDERKPPEILNVSCCATCVSCVALFVFKLMPLFSADDVSLVFCSA